MGPRPAGLAARLLSERQRHPHDEAAGGAGFELEVGWNPIVVTPELESTWEPTTYQGISIWGHTTVGQTVVDKLAQFKAGVQSLLQREETVPELAGRIAE